uniref:Uncharacterized protein n=1 Tax=Arundo donax TaxID=35708 RepID=A0A0A8XQV6_ARUDO
MFDLLDTYHIILALVTHATFENRFKYGFFTSSHHIVHP